MSELCLGTKDFSFSTIRVTNRVFPIPARCDETTLAHDLKALNVQVTRLDEPNKLLEKHFYCTLRG